MYYQNFESYHSLWSFKNSLFVLLVISLIVFFLASAIFFLFTFSDQRIKNFFLYVIFFSEFFFLYFSILLEKQRDQEIKKKFRPIYKNNQLNLLQIKKIWFRETLAIPTHEYISLIEKIEKYHVLHSKYQKNNVTREKIYNFIFSTDSKNRVLAMFMGLVALFTGLLISSGVNAEYIFSIFESIDILNSLLTICFISLLILGAYYIFKRSSYMFLNFLDFIFDNTFYSSNTSNRKKEIFISQLLQFCEPPKRRQKLYAELEISKKIDKGTIE